jgi:acetylornithine deacetylase/succinyl-diaminopimelate desuccinylase-like protein
MKISWQTFQQEALDCLRALVRLDTTNPPGNERIAADYIADALGAHGVESVIRESAPTRANLIARHKSIDSSAGALLLSSHTDVVPVERSGWTREPFSGEIADGCLWGRGSIDMKSKCAMDVVMMRR